MDRLCDRWKQNLLDLDKEDWKDCLKDSIKLLISSKHKLMQVTFLHRVHYNPQRLRSIYSQTSQGDALGVIVVKERLSICSGAACRLLSIGRRWLNLLMVVSS